MTRVMVDGRYLGGKPGGVGRYCYQCISAMQAQRPSLDWSFVVRRPGDQAPLESDAAVSFDYEPYGAATSLRLGRRLGPRPAELFHSPFHVLPLGLRCATVLTMHDVFNFTQPKTSNYSFPISWLEWAYFLAAIPESVRRADRIIAVSQTTADQLARLVGGCGPKIRVVHHGVTPTFRRLEDRAAVAKSCARLIGDDAPFFLSVGGISPNKNHEGMLEAFALAFGGDSGPKLAVVSRFGAPEKLQRRARQLGVSARYISVPLPSDDDLVALLNGALGLAFFSKVEGFGLPVLEAMACGCPVLTSNVSCLPEVAGEVALFADPLDVSDMARQMKHLASESALRADLRERGLERAAGYTWERAARLHLEVYDEALRR